MINKNLIIIVSVIIFTVLASFILWIIVGGDKPRQEAKILYLGPNKITEASDREYITVMSMAKNFENSGKFVEAITQYEIASKINRFVMPSYYPLLDIARIKCKQGDKLYAINTLKIFINHAENEINPTVESSFIVEDNTKEQIAYVKKKIIEAQELLNVCAGN